MDFLTRSKPSGQPQSSGSAPYRVLFVCLGNICRSPAAEMVFCQALEQAGLQGRISCDSCGTAAYHVGQQPDRRMLAALKRAGVPYNGHRGRQFCRADFGRFDLIIPQDEENRGDILSLALNDAQAAKVQPMSRWFGSRSAYAEVPDPYYGPDSGFDEVVELLQDAVARLLQELKGKIGA